MSDKDFKALEIFIIYVDAFYNDWGTGFNNADGRVNESNLEDALDMIMEAFASVPTTAFYDLDVNGDEHLTWQEFIPIIEQVCYAGEDWDLSAIEPLNMGVSDFISYTEEEMLGEYANTMYVGYWAE